MQDKEQQCKERKIVWRKRQLGRMQNQEKERRKMTIF